MNCCSGGRRFITRILRIFLLCSLVIFAIVQLKSIPLRVDVPYINSEHEPFDPLTQQAIDEEPFIDKSPSLSEEMLLKDIQKRIPNLPIAYWNKNKNKQMRLNKTCARFPSIFDMEFNNIYWQTLRTTNGTFQLFGAYLDSRSKNRLGPTVRILGMIDRVQPNVSTYCQFWFQGKKIPIIAKSFEYKWIWIKQWGNYRQGLYQPYLIACVIPAEFQKLIPQTVSLVENSCDNSTNNLRVIYNKPKEKKDFAVCVKGLDFLHEDLSVRLVEWIELLNLLGADKIFFYELQVHPNISKVLKYYEKEGKVQVTPISLAGGQPNAPSFQHLYLKQKVNNKRQNEVIPYNDCFYKHMYEYKYIALLDIDEVIMPIDGASWKELMELVLSKALKTNKEERATYSVRNVYFLDELLHNHGWFKDVPRYMHMLQHVYRAKNFTRPGEYVKCFHNTEKVLILHNHYPIACLGGTCPTYSIDTFDAQLQHYRSDCVKDLRATCEDFKSNNLLDLTIWKFKKPLIARVSTVLRTLGYFSWGKKYEDR